MKHAGKHQKQRTFFLAILPLLGTLLFCAPAAQAADNTGTPLYNTTQTTKKSGAAPLFVNRNPGSAGSINTNHPKATPYNFSAKDKKGKSSFVPMSERMKLVKLKNRAHALGVEEQKRAAVMARYAERDAAKAAKQQQQMQQGAAGMPVPVANRTAVQAAGDNKVYVYDKQKQQKRKHSLFNTP